MKILFIEDDPSAVDDAIELLEKAEFKAIVKNFTEANENLLKIKPDVVVLDLFNTLQGSKHVSEGGIV